MYTPDNLDIFEMHEREQERRLRRTEEIEKLPFDDERIEVAFYVLESEEDIEFLERFLNKHDFAYEKEVL